MPDHATANFPLPHPSPDGCVYDAPATIVHLPYDDTLDDETLAMVQARHPEAHADEHGREPCIAVVAGWWCALHFDEIGRDEELLRRIVHAGGWEERIEYAPRLWNPPAP
ncbi:MAG TPA: hypothetical protein VF494_00950 [Candidatus Limnocylindrales bacterium]